MLKQDQIDAFIQATRETARDVILPRYRNLDAAQIDTKSGPTDLVTVADREAEARLTQAARAILPGTAVVGEEAVAEDATLLDQIGSADQCVIIDPIDGTSNFVAGLGIFGVLLAVVEKGETVFGLLYDPVSDDWMQAVRGAGASYESTQGIKRKLMISSDRSLNSMTGLIPLSLASPAERASVAAKYEQVGRIRSLGCSCHEYRTLAFGQADFSVSGLLKPWDHAAGILLTEEAGGYVAFADDTPYRPTIHQGRIIAASSKEVHAQVKAFA